MLVVGKGMEEGRRLGRSKVDNTSRDVYLDPTRGLCAGITWRGRLGVRFIIEEAYGPSGEELEGKEILERGRVSGRGKLQSWMP
ncbi:hypothetical protein E2C01_004014 [Portunus trituberculatus]|uniref:Uncharacterized protein n=1 Tax=Portunus trituberculatus TaxID=210409 RepID=A0A5B7CRA2_PORTR|nr:hypothetical protein [Portunus trituberculatus]